MAFHQQTTGPVCAGWGDRRWGAGLVPVPGRGSEIGAEAPCPGWGGGNEDGQEGGDGGGPKGDPPGFSGLSPLTSPQMSAPGPGGQPLRPCARSGEDLAMTGR